MENSNSSSLFQLLRNFEKNSENIVSYKDNVAFIEGPKIEQFAPNGDAPSRFVKTEMECFVIEGRNP